MRLIVAVIFLLLSQSVTASQQRLPRGAAPETLAALSVLSEGSEYLVDVTQRDRMGTGRALRITCRSGCNGFARFEEGASGFPLGIFRLSDRNRLILVTWGGATTTILQVFEIREHEAVMVFDRHSISTPQVAEDRNGMVSLGTTEYPARGAGADRPLIVRNWVWDGHRFVELR